MHKTRV